MNLNFFRLDPQSNPQLTRPFNGFISAAASQGSASLFKDALLVSGFALLTALAAQIKVPLPFTPVPMTLQTLVVVFAGMLLGAKRGALSQILYLVAGLAGAPFFATTAGLAFLARPTAGYLIGFIPSALLAGVLMGQKPQQKGFLSLWITAFVASLPCLFLGAAWLKVWSNHSWTMALSLGVAPFLVGDLVKTTAAATMIALIRRK